jgi:TetR/AcrR family transcriptional regulator, cholesterol catabolism regulator
MARAYESSVRAQQARQTRQKLVSAGQELFLSQGWVPTTMTQVAAAAGVGRPTTYLHFATKLDLLTACIDASLSAVPVRERPDYQAMGSGPLSQRAATAARWLREAYQRSAAIQVVLDQAAVTTPQAAYVRAQMESRRHDEFANACRLVLGQPFPPASLVDEVWALGSRGMWFMVADRGWSPEEWEAWFTSAIMHAISRYDLG